MTCRRIWIAAWVLSALASPAVARPALVCRVTARIPFNAAHSPGVDSTRIFLQTAGLLEERRSGTSLVLRWTVVSDTPDQLVAVDLDRSLTLTIDRPGQTFAESGVMVQRRGYCRINELP
jgi:hypothetical protein